MSGYVEPRESIGYWLHDDVPGTLEALANRYVGDNPPTPFVFRAFSDAGILQTESGLYDMDLSKKLPHAKNGQFAYIYGLVWGDSPRSIDGLIECLGPTQLYLNDTLLFKSTAVEENHANLVSRVPLTFVKGWNTILIATRKTTAGFGCRFGADEAKVRILNVHSPFVERQGQWGWVFSAPLNEHLFQEPGSLSAMGSESATQVQWYPEVRWSSSQIETSPFDRIFGRSPGETAWARTQLQNGSNDSRTCRIRLRSSNPLRLWLDGIEIAQHLQGVECESECTVSPGNHDLLVRATCGDEGWETWIELSLEGSATATTGVTQPVPVEGYTGSWIYLGPIDPDVNVGPIMLQSVHRLIPQDSEESRRTYWRLDGPNLWLRPFYENAMLSNQWTTANGVTNFGRWDYQLGVAMYGLVETGRELDRPDIVKYVKEHISQCVTMYDYSLWDKEKYGFPSINHQMVLMEMLDNCGSFGSAMLEAFRGSNDADIRRVAADIADFITHRLERKDDGAWYRKAPGLYFDNTMWADDLYMGTPFLCRYAQLTGDNAVLDDAARQFLLFRKYLFMEDEHLMSHVYDFKYETATRIPWGRGNGWTLFSLSEILRVLPENHENRAELLAFFQEFSTSVLTLQSEEGLWRQVLNDSDAYLEASCTAMFIVSFARGVQYGWLESPQPYVDSVRRAWEGLTHLAFDRQGNVHGVCSGSRYGFLSDYYKHELRTVTNDNHGIGVMLLAGLEIQHMNAGLRSN